MAIIKAKKYIRENYNFESINENDELTDKELEEKINQSLNCLDKAKLIFSSKDLWKIAYIISTGYLEVKEIETVSTFILDPLNNTDLALEFFAEILGIISSIKIGKSLPLQEISNEIKELIHKYIPERYFY